MCSNEENIIVQPDNNKVSLHHTALSSLVSLLEYTYPVPEEKNVNIIDADLIPHTETTSPSSLNTTSPSITDKARASLSPKKKTDTVLKSQKKNKKKVSFAKKFITTVEVQCWKKYNVIDSVSISLLRRRNILEDEATTKCVCEIF